jgi:hypothetical protein
MSQAQRKMLKIPRVIVLKGFQVAGWRSGTDLGLGGSADVFGKGRKISGAKFLAISRY